MTMWAEEGPEGERALLSLSAAALTCERGSYGGFEVHLVHKWGDMVWSKLHT